MAFVTTLISHKAASPRWAARFDLTWVSPTPLFVLFLSSVSQAAEVMDVRLWRAPDHTRVVFDLSDTVAHSLIELDNPRRLVIDISDARLRDALTDLPLENTPISPRAIRYSARG